MVDVVFTTQLVFELGVNVIAPTHSSLGNTVDVLTQIENVPGVLLAASAKLYILTKYVLPITKLFCTIVPAFTQLRLVSPEQSPTNNCITGLFIGLIPLGVIIILCLLEVAIKLNQTSSSAKPVHPIIL